MEELQASMFWELATLQHNSARPTHVNTMHCCQNHEYLNVYGSIRIAAQPLLLCVTSILDDIHRCIRIAQCVIRY